MALSDKNDYRKTLSAIVDPSSTLELFEANTCLVINFVDMIILHDVI